MENQGQFCYKYWRPAVTTDCVIFGYDVKEGLSLLLVERGWNLLRASGHSREASSSKKKTDSV